MTSAQAMLNFIAVREQRLMHQVNRWQPPRWIRLWMLCATRGGDGWLWYAMGVVILMNGGPGTVWGPRAYAAFEEYAGPAAGPPGDGPGSGGGVSPPAS